MRFLGIILCTFNINMSENTREILCLNIFRIYKNFNRQNNHEIILEMAAAATILLTRQKYKAINKKSVHSMSPISLLYTLLAYFSLSYFQFPQSAYHIFPVGMSYCHGLRSCVLLAGWLAGKAHAHMRMHLVLILSIGIYQKERNQISRATFVY